MTCDNSLIWACYTGILAVALLAAVIVLLLVGRAAVRARHDAINTEDELARFKRDHLKLQADLAGHSRAVRDSDVHKLDPAGWAAFNDATGNFTQINRKGGTR